MTGGDNMLMPAQSISHGDAPQQLARASARGRAELGAIGKDRALGLGPAQALDDHALRLRYEGILPHGSALQSFMS